tara:strand:+ start:589 stop:1917 length:1329 start_codon:yes stop_codon:yes gene_type:complete
MSLNYEQFCEFLKRAKYLYQDILDYESNEIFSNFYYQRSIHYKNPQIIQILTNEDEFERNAVHIMITLIRNYLRNKNDNKRDYNALKSFAKLSELIANTSNHNLSQKILSDYRRTVPSSEGKVREVTQLLEYLFDEENKREDQLIWKIINAKSKIYYGIDFDQTEDFLEAQEILKDLEMIFSNILDHQKSMEIFVKDDEKKEKNKKRFQLYEEFIQDMDQWQHIATLRIHADALQRVVGGQMSIDDYYPFKPKYIKGFTIAGVARISEKALSNLSRPMNGEEPEIKPIDVSDKNEKLYDYKEALDWLELDKRKKKFKLYESIDIYENFTHDLILPITNKDSLKKFIDVSNDFLFLKSKMRWKLKSDFDLSKLRSTLNIERLEWLGTEGKSIEEITNTDNPYHHSPRSKDPLVHLKWDFEQGRIEREKLDEIFPLRELINDLN